MASTMCPFCDRHSHMRIVWAQYLIFDERYLLQGVATCDSCGRASLSLADRAPSGPDASNVLDSLDGADISWTPKKGDSPAFPDVPDHIALAAQEAHRAASINALMAAILMARTVVEATAKSKGIKSGFLVAKIDALAAAGQIRESTKDAAHEIRHFGNDMAHGDIEDLPGADDVEEVLSLMDEVLNEVFQGPARTARIKAKRTGSS